MIKPVGDSSITSLNKRTQSTEENVLPHSTKTSLEDQVKLSPEALSALQIRKWIQEVKDLPEVRADKISQAQENLKQDNYFEVVAENLSEDVASLFMGGESSID